MAILYVYDASGYLSGVHEGDSVIENATPLAPIYTEGYTPQFLNGAWVDQAAPPVISPATFRMLFSSPERIAIKAMVYGDKNATPPVAIDPIVEDWWSVVTDPQLTEVNMGLESVQAALGYLVAIGVLAESRVAEILSGRLK